MELFKKMLKNKVLLLLMLPYVLLPQIFNLKGYINHFNYYMLTKDLFLNTILLIVVFKFLISIALLEKTGFATLLKLVMPLVLYSPIILTYISIKDCVDGQCGFAVVFGFAMSFILADAFLLYSVFHRENNH